MAKIPKPNKSQSQSTVEEFIALFPGQHVYFWDNHSGSKTAHGQIGSSSSSILLTLDSYNKRGHSIYMTMSEVSKGNSRTKNDFVKACAIGLDDDQGKTDPTLFPIQPNVVIHTSPGKRQFLWLTETNDGVELEAVNRCLAENYHGDPAFIDMTRVCRMPGYLNHKYDIPPEVTYEILSKVPYEWSEITKHFPPIEKEVKRDHSGNKLALDITAATESIVTGEGSIYESCLPLIASLISSGMKQKAVHGLISGLLNTNNTFNLSLEGKDSLEMGARVTNSRLKIQEMIDTASAKFSVEEATKYTHIKGEDEGLPYTTLNWPPGFVGKLARRWYRAMYSPSREIAIAGAMHTVSVLGCGCYHYQGATVGRRRLVLAATGRGKSALSNGFYSILHSIQIPNIRELFVAEEANSALNLQVALNEHKLRSIISTERGLGGQSQVGDRAGKQRHILDGLSMKLGQAPLTMPQLSKRSADPKLKHGPVKDVILCMLEESTPETFTEEFAKSDSIQTGELARSEVFFIDLENTKEGINYDHFEHSQPTDIEIETFTVLTQQYLAANVIDGTDPMVTARHIPVDFSQVDEQLRAYNDSRYHLVTQEGIVRAQVTRERERIVSTCIVLATADSVNLNSEDPKAPVVNKEHLDYAIQYQNEIDRAVRVNIKTGALATTMSKAMERIHTALVILAEGDDADDKYLLRGNITSSWIGRKFRPESKLMKEFKAENKFKSRKQLIIDILDNAEIDGMLRKVPNKFDQWHSCV